MAAIPQYKTNPTTKSRPVQKRQVHRKYAVPKWNLIDKVMVGAVGLTILCMMLLVISMADRAAAANNALSVTTAQYTKVENENNDLKQEINDLSSPGRLDKIAKKYGLSMQNNNVRNVK
ncbi:cell division protein FtsL [Weissella tructae]|jgi:cell division protein FtsL|uniref:Cell division protein FtsL n=2 Tax=Weissella TaxID=46255 RepID=A0A075TY24_9LACO|nr:MULTISPECIES: cell division protein FtsL [Weissella]AIG65236.1 Cell division protein FtsL [Weissella tructae]AIM62549.1 Cell division protein FtsL [Weissella ceti]AIM63885.1 Cell division protein FtsL [Weissella ceti]ELA07636.1 cell division protein FtsL [Weissella ceti NC36]QVV91614.1 cell division protein FtsL [Weissella tructae]